MKDRHVDKDEEMVLKNEALYFIINFLTKNKE